jgi:hypothetical protein
MEQYNPEDQKKSAYQTLLYNKNVGSLIFASIWKEKDNQHYSDLYHLVHAGIPDEIRTKIWRELLKVSIQEV